MRKQHHLGHAPPGLVLAAAALAITDSRTTATASSPTVICGS